MNFCQARQIETGPNKGKWHFTRYNDNDKQVRPIGACAYHGPHDTQKEAEACYHKHTVERSRHYAVRSSGLCVGGCGEQTNMLLTWGRGQISNKRVCDKCFAATETEDLIPMTTHSAGSS